MPATAIISGWQKMEHSLRQTLVEALLQLDTNAINQSGEYLSDLFRKLNEISTQIKNFSDNYRAIENNKREGPNTGLSHHFVETIKVSIRPGVSLGD